MDVATCVKNVITAYRNAASLVRRIKEKRKDGEAASAEDGQLRDLEDSLALGPPVVQGQYDHDLKRWGESYACGDGQAREQMKDVLISIQIAVLSNLQMVFMDDGPLDYAAMQTASDDSRVNAVVCLGQLSQRMSAAAAAHAMLPQHRAHSAQYPGQDPIPMSPSLQYSSSRSTHSSLSGSTPMTPDSTADRLAYMGFSHTKRRPSVAARASSVYSATERAPSTYSAGSQSRPPFPQQTTSLRGELDVPPPLFSDSQRLSTNPSLEGLRRPSSHTLTPEDSQLLMPGGFTQSPEPTSRPHSDQGEEQDQTSFVSSYENRQGQYSPELSRTPSGKHSDMSRNRFDSNNYGELSYSRGGLDDPKLNYGDMYRNRIDTTAGRRPIPQYPTSSTSNHSTLEHVAYLQNNARPPIADTSQPAATAQSPSPQPPSQQPLPQQPPPQQPPPLQSPIQQSQPQPSLQYTQSLNNGVTPRRPVPYRIHDGVQPQQAPPVTDRTSSLISSPTIMERANSPLSSTISHASSGPSHSPDRGHPARTSFSAPIPVTTSPPTTQPLHNPPPSTGPHMINPFNNAEHVTNSTPASSSSTLANKPAPINHLTSVLAAIPIPRLRNGSASTTSSTPKPPSLSHFPAPPGAANPNSPTSPTNTSLTLPTDSNTHGFCKSAVRLQATPTPTLPANFKKSFTIAHRPAGLTGTIPYWSCAKCAFEGPVVMSVPTDPKKKGKPDKVFDPRIRVSESGIRYRWQFLAKSHVPLKNVQTEGPGQRDGSFGAFACVFCCAEGPAKGWLGAAGVGLSRGAAPTFGNVAAFMEHLNMHRSGAGKPSREVLERAKAVFGRVAEPGEDFDICLPPR